VIEEEMEMGDTIIKASIGLAICLIAKYVKDVAMVLRDIRDILAKQGCGPDEKA
jgi:hypothetical protein